MKRMRIAIIGLGRLGHKCAETVSADQDTELAGIVHCAAYCHSLKV